MKRDQRGGVGLLCEAGRVLRGPGSSVAHFCSTVTRPLLHVSPSPRLPSPLDICARGLLSRAFKGSLLMVPCFGPQCKLSSVSEGHCSPVRVSSLLLRGLLCIFLLICCHRCVLTEITPLLTVRILMCPTTADIKCSLIPTRALPSGVCTFHTAGRGLLRENVPCCIESSEK